MKCAVKSTARRFVLTCAEDQMQCSRLIQSLVQSRIRWELPCIRPLCVLSYMYLLAITICLYFVSYFVSLDYLIYSIWKRKRKELITSSRDVSQCWCSGPLMNSCSVRLSTKVFHRIFDRMLEETLTRLVAIRHKQSRFTFLQMTGAFIQSKLQCITLLIYSGNISAKLWNFVKSITFITNKLDVKCSHRQMLGSWHLDCKCAIWQI